MQRAFQIAGAAIFLLACFLEWEASTLRYYTELGPGPGFFAVWLAGLMAVLALGLTITASLASPTPLPMHFWPARSGYFRLAAIILSIAWMAFFLDRLGYRITSFVFLIVLGHVFGLRNWLLLLGAAIVGSLGIFYLFNDLLSTPLPQSAFGI